jgi:hypothetical protein
MQVELAGKLHQAFVFNYMISIYSKEKKLFQYQLVQVLFSYKEYDLTLTTIIGIHL